MTQPPPSLRRRTAHIRPVYLVLVAWAALVVIGFAGLFAYASRPGDDISALREWPASSHLPRDPSRLTLVVFAHPRCPCTEATLQELAGIMDRVGRRLSVTVVFLQPRGESSIWTTDSRNWQAAAAIPDVKVIRDVDGAEAKSFGAKTSGRTILFDRDGRVLFQGGITAARGMVGSNVGSEAVIATAEDTTSLTGKTETFGCPLFAFERKTK